MTDAQAFALAGGIVGGMLALVIIFGIAFYVLLVIALWKIFAKAGEAGWKSLIPIYNLYVYCRIISVSFWVWFLLIPIVVGIASAFIFKDNQNAINTVSAVYSLCLEIYTSIKLAKAFGKGTGFTVGLIFLPNIFQLILGFGNSQYIGAKEA